jgi:threonine aldolase
VETTTVVDLRSDTVTQPTLTMRAAMAEAEVGDDLSREDPTVNRLESLAAALTGKEAALYVPTGTMANQLAIRAHTRPGTEIVCAPRAHVFCYEDAGAARNAGAQMRPIADWSELARVIESSHHHMPVVSLVAIENTYMPEQGRPFSVDEVRAIADAAHAEGVAVHCDGARIWNASVALGAPPSALVEHCDTVMFCLSKGLGAPIGSLLCGPEELVDRARDDKHRLGGGWRQAGIVAAAGIVALETMVERLADDHARAHAFAASLAAHWPGALDADDVRTNIVCGDARHLPDDFVARLTAQGVLCDMLDPVTIRWVFHNDVDDAGLAHAIAVLDAFGQEG